MSQESSQSPLPEPFSNTPSDEVLDEAATIAARMFEKYGGGPAMEAAANAEFAHNAVDNAIKNERVTIKDAIIDGMRKERRIEREQSEEEKAQLRHEVAHDKLTGLLGLEAFWNEVEAETGHKRRQDDDYPKFHVARIDLDRFREFNEKYSHGVADNALRSLSSILQKHLPDGSFAGRVGGDEFAILFKGASKEEVEEFLEEIRIRISVMGIQGIDEKITASIGFAELNQGEDMFVADLHADSAAYESKNNGRNRVSFFNPKTDTLKFKSNGNTKHPQKGN